MTSIVVAQLGSRMHYAVPRMLERHGLLKAVFTDFCASTWPGILLQMARTSWLPGAARRMQGRRLDGVPRRRIHASARLGISYAIARRRARSADDMAAVNIAFGKHLGEMVVESGMLDSASAVFGYSSASLELLRHARDRGKLALMEQTIAPKSVELEILSAHTVRYPGWAEKAAYEAYGATSGVREFVERERQEWDVADLILCGSTFVRDGIAKSGGPAHKCRVVPYGVGEGSAWFQRGRVLGRKLRVLTVGAVGLRKGSPVLAEVARASATLCEFKAVGPLEAPAESLSGLARYVTLCGVVPRQGMSELYRWADLLFLPSLCEGSATVTYEALCAGLPVVCSYNTGSQVTDGLDGFVCVDNAAATYVDLLGRLACDPELLQTLSANTRGTREALTEAAYERRFLSAISSAPSARS